MRALLLIFIESRLKTAQRHTSSGCHILVSLIFSVSLSPSHSLSPVVPKHDFCLSEALMSFLKTHEIRGTEPGIRKDIGGHVVPHPNLTNSCPLGMTPVISLPCVLQASEVNLSILHSLVSGLPSNITHKKIFLK